MKRKILIVLFSLLAVLLAAAGGFVIWAETPLGPLPDALQAMQSDELVRVENSPWLTFTPLKATPQIGFIFYPGGRVDMRSYAPEARAIASRGYLVLIVPMPLNLAIFGLDKADEVIAVHPEIKTWAVGGHSLGGAMAARYVYNHPQQVQGLVLWASYPASSDNLSASSVRVASVFGSLDGVCTSGKIDASRSLLPGNTRWEKIIGGNHAQFGWYGTQPGDNEASISRQDQQDQVVRATVEFLQSLLIAK